mgnify:CR=1 FL=1
MKVTKIEMAQTIVKVIWNMDKMPSSIDTRVKYQARFPKYLLIYPYEQALKIQVMNGEIMQNTMDWKMCMVR